mgnify:CR=1 FL=1
MSVFSYIFSLPRRWWHRHGFNVQSPWAYEFVRDALTDKSWFYLFDQLSGTKADRQLFRIVYWLGAKDVVAHTDDKITKAHLVGPLSKRGLNDGGMAVRYYDRNHLPQLEADIRARVFDERSCIIMEDIRHDGAQAWGDVHELLPTTSSFDLGKRGVAFFDPARQRQKYIL